MNRTMTALTVAATMFASSAPAFDPDDLQELKDTIQCESCDLMGADLEGANLAYSDLEGADLEGAILMDANLALDILNRADLRRANLRNASLNSANLRGANLEGADLAFTQMNGAILCNTTMPDGSVIYSGC